MLMPKLPIEGIIIFLLIFLVLAISRDATLRLIDAPPIEGILVALILAAVALLGNLGGILLDRTTGGGGVLTGTGLVGAREGSVIEENTGRRVTRPNPDCDGDIHKSSLEGNRAIFGGTGLG